MQIVLPGALPDAEAARELSAYLPKTAPTLLHWLERSRWRTVTADPAYSGCTPYEHWELDICGFRPAPDQLFSAGLAPLRLHEHLAPDRAVWLAELAHVSPSRDGAALLPANTLEITPEQSVSLFQSASELFAENGFRLQPHSAEQWRIDLPEEWRPKCASPALVGITSVNDWWTQDLAGRPWRKLVNELQMLWFDHPVNKARHTDNQLPINSLWLYGGASLSQLQNKRAATGYTIDASLLESQVRHDWGGWLAALTRLEAELFLPLANKQPNLVLTGSDRYIEITPSSLARWKNYLPGNRNTWRQWWSRQN